MKIGKLHKGFSLVEIIVVLVISASLGAVIYTTLAQGIRLWERSAKDRGEWKVALLAEKVTEEIRNAFQDPKWIFQGTEYGFHIATVGLNNTTGKVNDSKSRILYLRYLFNMSKGTINVQRYGFEEVFSPKPFEKPYITMLNQVRTFKLEYYAYDAWTKKYYWVSKWDRSCFPKTVKVTIEHEQIGNHKLTRMISMPTGGVCQA